MYGRCLHRTKSKGVMTMKQIDKSVNSLVRKIKQDERLKDFTFVKGFSTVEHPDPLSGYLIAVSTLDIGVGTRFVGESVGENLRGMVQNATVKFRVYAPKNDGGDGLLSLCCDLCDAIEKSDTLNVCEDVKISPIAFDNDANTVYRDVVATLSFCVYEEVAI